MELLRYAHESQEPHRWYVPDQSEYWKKERHAIPNEYLDAEGRLFTTLESPDGVTVRVYSDGDEGMKPPYTVIVGRGEKRAAAIYAADFPDLVRLLAELRAAFGL